MADMELDMVADKEVDKVAVGWSRVLVNWAKTFLTLSLPDLCVFYCFASLFCSHSVLHSSKMVLTGYSITYRTLQWSPSALDHLLILDLARAGTHGRTSPEPG